MGKRAIEEVAAEDGTIAKSDSLSRKKSRKDKSDKTRKPASLDITEENNAEVPADEVDKDKLTKAERKAAKKARKEAKEAKKAKKAKKLAQDVATPAKE